MSSIAVFDSGVGGISVLKELVKVLPNENFLFYGDSKNAPYGTKTLDEVRKLTCEHAKKLLVDDGCKGLVVACNTATSAAVRVLREMYPNVPIVGIEPAVKPAVLCKAHPKVLVMATPMTISQEKLRKLIDKYSDKGDIIPLPCPGLMDFVERGDLEGDDLRKYLTELLYEYRDNKVDSVVLGCTHYPFAKKLIQEILGDKVLVFDGAEGTAREMKRRLQEADLLENAENKGVVEFRNSLDGEKNEQKVQLCERLFTRVL